MSVRKSGGQTGGQSLIHVWWLYFFSSFKLPKTLPATVFINCIYRHPLRHTTNLHIHTGIVCQCCTSKTTSRGGAKFHPSTHLTLFTQRRMQRIGTGSPHSKGIVNQNQNQKSFNVPQTGKFVCHISDRIWQKQKHITRTETIAKISNKIKKGWNKLTYIYIHIYMIQCKIKKNFVLFFKHRF